MTRSNFKIAATNVFHLYESGHYAQALAACEYLQANYGEQATQIRYWRACLLAVSGQEEYSIAVIDEGVEVGLWWSQQMLRDEPDLATLQGNPRFEQLVKICTEREEQATRESRPERIILEAAVGGKDAPTLVVLHGRTEAASDRIDEWLNVSKLGIRIILLQSTQEAFAGGYCWDDPDKTSKEVREHLALLFPGGLPTTPWVALAGFSQGASRAIWLGQSIEGVRGVLAIAPGRRIIEQFESLEQPVQVKKIPVYLVIGSADWGFKDHDSVKQALNKLGIPCQVQIVNGLDHDYPDDLAAIIEASKNYFFQQEET